MQHSLIQSKFLNYASLQAVLTHMEPNLRIHLSICCRSLRSAEKSVPLKCNLLELENIGEEAVKINDTSYWMGIFMKYATSEKKVPWYILAFNEKGGLNCDIDKEGRREWETQKMVLPGDIVLREDNFQRIPDKRTKGFEPFLQFSAGKYIEAERVMYNKTLLDARKYLTSRLFGGRQHPIIVRRFKVEGNILRLSEDVKFQIRELSTELPIGRQFEALEPLLTSNKFPLDWLRVCYSNDTSLENIHPIIKSSRSIFIDNYDKDDDPLEFLMALPNENLLTDISLQNDMLVSFIENWKRTNRGIGTSISFQAQSTVDVDSALDFITNFYDHLENLEGDVLIPLNRTKGISLLITTGEDKSECAKRAKEVNEESYGDHEKGFELFYKLNFLKMEIVSAEMVGNRCVGLHSFWL